MRNCCNGIAFSSGLRLDIVKLFKFGLLSNWFNSMVNYGDKCSIVQKQSSMHVLSYFHHIRLPFFFSFSQVVYDRMTGRSRGFGFVTMSTAEEVGAAVEQFNGYVSILPCLKSPSLGTYASGIGELAVEKKNMYNTMQEVVYTL